MLDEIGLVHMNGRIYDALLGRFLSADPNIQFPANLQSFNRYSYVLNNPLSFSDPSGYFLKGLFNFFKRFWRPILAIIVTILIAYVAPYLLGSVNNLRETNILWAMAGGAAGGAITGGVKGAVLGAFGAGLSYGIGVGFREDGVLREMLGSGAEFVESARAMAHGISGGITSELGGGNFVSGFLSGSVSTAVTHNVEALNFDDGWNVGDQIVAAVVGGTASVLGGGKFENGAVTGAFQFLFNQTASEMAQRGKEQYRIAVLIARLDSYKQESQRAAYLRYKWNEWGKEHSNVIVTVLEVDAAVEFENFDNIFAANRHYDGLIVQAHGSTEYSGVDYTGERVLWYLRVEADWIEVWQEGFDGSPNWATVLGIENINNVQVFSCNPEQGRRSVEQGFMDSVKLVESWLSQRHQ